MNAIKCPLDRDDETLESWRLKRGAQKCPGCMKIIEKDDPSTCNHMVHKSTDAIPCLQERTDFCCTYLSCHFLTGYVGVHRKCCCSRSVWNGSFIGLSKIG